MTKALVLREMIKAVPLFSEHFWPEGAELGKMSFTIVFVFEKYNFEAQLVFWPLDPFNTGIHIIVSINGKHQHLDVARFKILQSKQQEFSIFPSPLQT